MLLKIPLPDCLRHRLAREIALAIAIKLVVIVAIFFAFFDGRTVHTDPDSVAERIAGPQSLPPNPVSGNAHAD